MICKTNGKNRRRKWIAFVLLLAVISSILCACVAQSEEKIEFQYGIQEHVSDFSGFDGGMENEKFIEYADEIINGTLYVTYQLKGYPYELGKIDWDVSYTESPNTFQLYLQGLSCLQILGQAYRLNGNVEYLRVGEKILEEWRAYQKTPASSENPMCWDDHGAVVRAESILYFMICCENTEIDTPAFRQEIYGLLADHAAFLADEKNYIESHNHGIMQDCALLHIAYYIDAPESEEWIQLAKERLKEQKKWLIGRMCG